MSIGDLNRVKTNTQSLQALGQFNKTNAELGMRQLRLATGSRLNRAEDDSAGYSIAKKLESRTRGQAQAMANVGDAKSMLSLAEGSLGSTMDILQTMKEKAVQAANDTLGDSERAAIQNQLDALRSEIDDIIGDSEFNGKSLFSADAATSFTFQVGAEQGDSFQVDIASVSADALLGEVTPNITPATETVDTSGTTEADWAGGAISVDPYTGANDTTYYLRYHNDGLSDHFDFSTTGDFDAPYDIIDISGYSAGDDITYTDSNGGTITFQLDAVPDSSLDSQGFTIAATAAVEDGTTGGLDVSTNAGAGAAIATIDAAIQTLSDQLGSIGDSQNRLSFKQDNLQTSMENNESARSRIEDADFAKEQMEIVKLQILQQTGLATLAQSNSASQSVLSLIG